MFRCSSSFVIWNQLLSVKVKYEGFLWIRNILDKTVKRYLMNCQALVPNPKPISPQSQPSPTQFETQINPKGTGADTKIL